MVMKLRLRCAIALAMMLALGVVLAGCASATVDPAQLETTWTLESFGGTTALVPADSAVKTTLTMDAGKTAGNGGVNSFSGDYKATDDGKISFGPQAATMMAGEAAAMEQEAAFFSALEKARTFEFNEGKLVLGDLGNNTLIVMVRSN